MSAASAKSPRRLWLIAYVAIACLSTVAVAVGNERISAILAASSQNTALGTLAFLPLLAIATRPQYIRRGEREEERRVIGIVWALRNGKLGFIVRSIVLWALLLAATAVVFVVIFRSGGAVAVATISNWLLVASACVLVTHLIPVGNLRLPPGRAVQIHVLGPEGAGKTTFMLLAPLESPRDAGAWQLGTTPQAATLIGDVYVSRRMKSLPKDVPKLQHVAMRRRAWSGFVGVRPQPVDFIRVRADASPTAWKAARKSGFAVVLPRDFDTRALRHELGRARRIAGARMKIRQPVAVVLTRCDDAGERSQAMKNVSEDVKNLLDSAARRWSVFATTDRAAGDSEEFAPAGQRAAVLWLLETM